MQRLRKTEVKRDAGAETDKKEREIHRYRQIERENERMTETEKDTERHIRIERDRERG